MQHQTQKYGMMRAASASLLNRIHQLRLTGLIPNKATQPTDQELRNRFASDSRKIEQVMRAEAVKELRASSWRQPSKSHRNTLQHQKLQVGDFDTMKDVIRKNRTNLKHLKEYSHNLKQSIRTSAWQCSTTENKSIKKSELVQFPKENLVEDFVDCDIAEPFPTGTKSAPRTFKSHSVMQVSRGRMPSQIPNSVRPFTQAPKTRRNPDKEPHIRKAIQQITSKQRSLYNTVQRSLHRNNTGAISTRSNLSRANILYQTRWNKMFTSVVDKYNLPCQGRFLTQFLDKPAPPNGTHNPSRRCHSSRFYVQQDSGILRKTPDLEYSRQV